MIYTAPSLALLRLATQLGIVTTGKSQDQLAADITVATTAIYDTLQMHSNSTDPHGLPQLQAQVNVNGTTLAQIQLQSAVNSLLTLGTRTVLGKDTFTRADGVAGTAEVGGAWSNGGANGLKIAGNAMVMVNPAQGSIDLEYLNLTNLAPVLHLTGLATVIAGGDQSGVGLVLTVGGAGGTGYTLVRYSDALVFKTFYGPQLWAIAVPDLLDHRIDLILNGNVATFLLDMKVVGSYTFTGAVSVRSIPTVYLGGTGKLDNFLLEAIS